MADTWRERWACLIALQERIEQHATGRKGSPVDADADFESFLVGYENLRDAVKKEFGRSNFTPSLVDEEIRNVISLQLAHDLAIKVKHEVQSEPPWSMAIDAAYTVRFSKGLPEPPSPFTSRARWTTVPGTQPTPLEPEPRRWVHQWEIRYTAAGSSTLVVDGVQFSRDVIADWRTFLAARPPAWRNPDRQIDPTALGWLGGRPRWPVRRW